MARYDGLPEFVDLKTRRAKPFASVKLLAAQTDSGFGGFTHQGG